MVQWHPLFKKKLLKFYKRILITNSDPLVDAIVEIFRSGFGLTVDDTDEYREIHDWYKVSNFMLDELDELERQKENPE